VRRPIECQQENTMSSYQTDTVIGPAAYASYFINGDASGLSDEERAQADAWAAFECGSAGNIVDCSEPYYSNGRYAWRFTPYNGGEVCDYAILYRVPDQE
jgi:hypothetical protein